MSDFVKNLDDELHCLQCSLIMLWQDITGEIMNMEDAERISGFRTGVETWPYATLAWFIERGMKVIHIDPIAISDFATNPRQAMIEANFSPEDVDYLMDISDFDSIKSDIQQCMSSRNFSSSTENPSSATVIQLHQEGWRQLLTLNSASLHTGALAPLDGHMVYVKDVSEDTITLADPGPPPIAHFIVNAATLDVAFNSPYQGIGGIIAVKTVDY